MKKRLRQKSWYDAQARVSMALCEEGFLMRRFKMTGLVVFILGCTAASAAVAQTRGKTDGCLVTLYNYPAETPRSDAAAKAPAPLGSSLALRGELRAGEADANAGSRTSLQARRRPEK